MRCPNCETGLVDREVDGRRWRSCPTCEFVAPPNSRKIDAIWAFLSVDEDSDCEGLPALQVGDKVLPMVAADPDRLEGLRGLAEQMSRRSGMRMTLVKFTKREEVEVYEGV